MKQLVTFLSNEMEKPQINTKNHNTKFVFRSGMYREGTRATESARGYESTCLRDAKSVTGTERPISRTPHTSCGSRFCWAPECLRRKTQ